MMTSIAITIGNISAIFSVSQLAVLIAVTFLTCYIHLKDRLSRWKGVNIPVGPSGYPIIGCLPYLKSFPEVTLDRWAKKYGPMYSMWLGNQLFVVVSDSQIAKDLFVQNGAILSSRKDNFIKSRLILAQRGITAMPYGDDWKKHRRIAASFLNPRAVLQRIPVLDQASKDLVKDMYLYSKGGSHPLAPQPHVGRSALNNMLSTVFGLTTENMDDPIISRALNISREFMNCTGPVSNYTDFVPLLQHIPNTMTSRAKRLHRTLLETYGAMLNQIETRIHNKEDVPESLAKTLILSREKENLDWLDMTMLCAAFMIGGIETTASLIQWFCAVIPSYPDIQRKAHAELDAVVGTDRMPALEDEKNLPYIHALIMELERTHSPFWLGTPHQSTEEFTYRGQNIPKGTVVICNSYTMNHDPQRYSDPMDFQPDRFMPDVSSVVDNASSRLYEPDQFTFGAGRRICPGKRYAEHELFLAISRILWAYRVEEVPGETINLHEYDGLSGRSPIPFRIKLIPRYDQTLSTILEV